MSVHVFLCVVSFWVFFALEGENTKKIQSSLMYDSVPFCVVSVSKEVSLIKVIVNFTSLDVVLQVSFSVF